MKELAWDEVRARRLAPSFLLEPASSVVDVVRGHGAVQAQVLSAAELAVALRVDRATVEDVRRSLYERREIVKTWSVRGTLHLVAADELPLWAAAVRGRQPYWEDRAWLAAHDLDARSARAIFAAIADALDGACLTRAELADAVSARVGRRHERLSSAWGELLTPPTYEGKLCFGPPRGSHVTFVRADQWIGGWRDVDPQEARREVLRRFVSAYGPADADAFRHWSGFGRDAAKVLFDEVRGELAEVEVQGKRQWLLSRDEARDGGTATSVRLVPQYDPYVIGFRPREPILPEVVKARIRSGGRGRLEGVASQSVVLVDGAVTGLWRRARRRGGVDVEVEHVLPLPRGRKRALAGAVERVRAALA
jgi:hypothetical protein